jgi:hypothetical protein
MAIEYVPYNLTPEQVVELWGGRGPGDPNRRGGARSGGASRRCIVRVAPRLSQLAGSTSACRRAHACRLARRLVGVVGVAGRAAFTRFGPDPGGQLGLDQLLQRSSQDVGDRGGQGRVRFPSPPPSTSSPGSTGCRGPAPLVGSRSAARAPQRRCRWGATPALVPLRCAAVARTEPTPPDESSLHGVTWVPTVPAPSTYRRRHEHRHQRGDMRITRQVVVLDAADMAAPSTGVAAARGAQRTRPVPCLRGPDRASLRSVLGGGLSIRADREVRV